MHIHLWTRLYLDMYVYSCLYKTYIKLEGFLDLMIFIFLRNFVFELNCLFPWLCISHYTCTLTSFLFTHDLFSWDYICFIDPWVFNDHVIFIFSWNIFFLFYSLLEGFRTSLQIFHITSSYSLYGRVFKRVILFSNLFLKTLSIYGQTDGRVCLASLIENFLPCA